MATVLQGVLRDPKGVSGDHKGVSGDPRAYLAEEFVVHIDVIVVLACSGDVNGDESGLVGHCGETSDDRMRRGKGGEEGDGICRVKKEEEWRERDYGIRGESIDDNEGRLEGINANEKDLIRED